MSPDKYDTEDRYPADTELKFFGTITASVTHELNNVISIISQTGGLLEDLLAGTKQNRPIEPERLERIAEKVSIQTERGIKIIKRLNSFAHSTDISTGSFDLNELLENLGALMERFISLKGASLTLELSNGPLEITNNQLKVQQVIFLALKAILPLTQKNDSIIISSGEIDSDRKITIQLKTDRDCPLPDISNPNTHASRIGARLNSNTGPAGPFIEIILPRTSVLDNI